MKNRVWSLLFCLLSLPLAAQMTLLRGNVIDALTRQPLSGATVQVGNVGTATADDGSFELSLSSPAPITVQVRYIGYETLTQPLNPTAMSDLIFALQPETTLLQTATVTTSKFEKPLGEVTVSLEVIRPQALKSLNITSADEMLDRVSGVTIIDGQANIRGGSGFSYGAGSRVLLLVDDLPALQADAGFPNWDDLPVENVQQIEVLKGAASALYGSSAMNGIINLRTAYAKSEPETEAAVFTTVYGNPRYAEAKWWGRDTSEIVQPFQTGLSVAHRQKRGRWDAVLSGYGLYRDSYNRQTYTRYARITPSFRFRVNDRLSIALTTNFNAGRSSNFFLWGNDTQLAMQPGMNSVGVSKGRFRFTIDPTVSYFDRYDNRHKLLGRLYFVNNNNDRGQSNRSVTQYGEYQFQRNFAPQHLVLTGGVVGSYSTVTAQLYGDTSYSIRNAALYLQADKKLWQRLSVSAGARYEQNAIYSPTIVEGDTIPNGVAKEGKPVFRIGLNYQAGKATYLRASLGQGYRFPTIAEKFITTSFGIADIVPNVKLVSETGISGELGIKQGFQWGTWQGFGDAAFFWSEYNNMMEFNFVLLPAPRFIGFQSQNIGNTRITGTELSLAAQGKIGNVPLNVVTGYTYINPVFRQFTQLEDSLSSADYNVLKYRFRHSFKFDGEVKLLKERWTLGININHNSFMEAIDAVFAFFITGLQDWRTRHPNGTWVIDARTAYQVSPRWKISFIAGNITNLAYTVRPALMEAPRNFTLRADYSFK